MGKWEDQAERRLHIWHMSINLVREVDHKGELAERIKNILTTSVRYFLYIAGGHCKRDIEDFV